MALRIVKRQKDKYGNVWLRDQYGGWTNEYGVRFTKTEHRRFGYEIRKANRRIKDYMEKYPKTSTMRAKDIGERYRLGDLARFRRRSAYSNYLKVTQRISTGEQLYVRQPKNYKNNMLKGLASPEINRLAKYNPELANKLKQAKGLIKNLTNEQVIQLSRDARTPDINAYYTILPDVQTNNLDRLINIIMEL